MLDGKKVLVAGAGGLLGSRVVRAVLEHGGEVVAVDIDRDALEVTLQKAGCMCADGALHLQQLDLTDSSQVEAFFAEARGLTGAVNCSYPRNKQYGAHFFDVSLESFNENLALHLGSAFLFSQQCAAYFNRTRKPFSLVNLGSIYGASVPRFDIYEGTDMTVPVEYVAIKSAIIQLTKYICAYVNDSGFRANCVSPGGIEDGQPESFLEAYAGNTLGKGMLGAGDIVGAICFLLSGYSEYMVGQNLVIDDGFSLS